MTVDVSAPLPDMSLRDQSILTVHTGNASTLITQLVIHVSQNVPADALPSLPPLLTYIPSGD